MVAGLALRHAEPISATRLLQGNTGLQVFVFILLGLYFARPVVTRADKHWQ